MIDSRVKHTNLAIPVTHPTLPLERTYCANCGKPKGWVSTECYNFIKLMNIIVICEDCEAKLGKPGLVEAKISEIPV